MIDISADTLCDLAPTGKLRTAVIVAPAPSVFFAARDSRTDEVSGVTVDLGRALADELNIPLDLVIYPNSGEATEAGARGDWDVSFMPADAARAQKIDFGPAYYTVESTFLVPAGSPFQTLDEVNRTGVEAVAIFGTTTSRSARRFLTEGSVVEVRSIDEMLARAKVGQGDAFALSHDSFAVLLPEVPGARVLPGNFQQVGVAIGVPKGRGAALSVASDFLTRAKASGQVRRLLDAHGFVDAKVAP